MSDQPAQHGAGENALELLLLRLRYREGKLVPLEANAPLLLDDPGFAYVVYTGRVDIFAARIRDGKPVTPRHHVMSVEAGEVFFGLRFSLTGDAVGLLATGVPETSVIRLPRRALQEIGGKADFVDLVCGMLDRWVDGLASGIVGGLIPQGTLPLDPGTETELRAVASATAREGVVWIRLQSGSVLFTDREDVPPLLPDGFVPISSSTWLRSTEDVRLEAVGTRALMTADPDWQALSSFHDLAVDMLRRNIARAEDEERTRLRRKAESDRGAVQSTMVQIASVMRPDLVRGGADETSRDPLLAACKLVAEAMGIDFARALHARPPEGYSLGVADVARFGAFRYREVAFEGRWWTRDNGPLLAFLAESGHPVALLPGRSGAYDLHDPVAARPVRLTAELASTLALRGFMFYRPFPARAMDAGSLIRFGVRAIRRDLTTILGIGVFTGILGLIVPITTQTIFDSVVPNKDRTQLLAVGLFLLSVAIVTGVFQILQSIAVLRVQGHLDSSIQSAVWDRLLDLPVPFFRGYSAGDLGNRAMGFTMIRQLLSGPITTTFLTAIFSVFNLVLLFHYSVPLALVALLVVVVAVATVCLLGYLAVGPQRTLAEIEGRISGVVLQVINGIAKFRVAGAEDRAFDMWGEQFAAQRRVAYRARQFQNYILVFSSAYSVIAGLAIFGAYAAAGSASLTPGEFIAFNAAFTQLLLNGLQLTSVFVTVLLVVPLYERARPILEALPEVDDSKTPPGALSGEIEANRISFRYAEDGPLVLDDISVSIKPGEMVALVGPSGSGKSSLLRLLMGFEAPETGAVYYNGHDLATLNVTEVRRQIGTVIQSGKVVAGSILTNIIGSSLLTIDDAWEAARMAGLDADIRKMPMGMHTMVSEEGGTFSGGQAQRLLIAQALARRPRIIFFDEATSALDNATQEIVSESLEKLNATRLIIAHRLSTIVKADRIYVMERGKVVQMGTYAELVRQPGLFADLAKRQIL